MASWRSRSLSKAARAPRDDALEASEHLGDVFEVPEIVGLSQSGVSSQAPNGCPRDSKLPAIKPMRVTAGLSG